MLLPKEKKIQNSRHVIPGSLINNFASRELSKHTKKNIVMLARAKKSTTDVNIDDKSKSPHILASTESSQEQKEKSAELNLSNNKERNEWLTDNSLNDAERQPSMRQ